MCGQIAKLFDIEDSFGWCCDPFHHTAVSLQFFDVKAWVRCLVCPSVKESSRKPRDFTHAHDVGITEVRMSSLNELFAAEGDMNKNRNGLRVEQFKA